MIEYYDESSIPVSTIQLGVMPMNTTLRSSLLSITECENLHWRFEVRKTSNQFVAVSLIASGETHGVSVRGQVICGAHEGVFNFNATLAASGMPYFMAPAIAVSRFGPAGYIRVELTFTNYTLIDRLAGLQPISSIMSTNSNHEVELRCIDGVFSENTGFLMTISVVFSAALTANWQESKTRIIKVDYTVNTTKSVFCALRGQPSVPQSLPSYLKISEFCNYYEITSVLSHLHSLQLLRITRTHLPAFWHYAWATNNEQLKIRCSWYFRANFERFLFDEGIITLPPVFIGHLVQGASEVPHL